MSNGLSNYEREQVLGYLDGEREERRRSALSSRNSFFGWLRSVGLGYIIGKIIDIAWQVIKRLFGF